LGHSVLPPVHGKIVAMVPEHDGAGYSTRTPRMVRRRTLFLRCTASNSPVARIRSWQAGGDAELVVILLAADLIAR
jgi:hypothetical protein